MTTKTVKIKQIREHCCWKCANYIPALFCCLLAGSRRVEPDCVCKAFSTDPLPPTNMRCVLPVKCKGCGRDVYIPSDDTNVELCQKCRKVKS